MSHYGFAYDTNVNLERQPVYDVFIAYFENMRMKKIKNTDTHSVYAAEIRCMLTERRYVIATTPRDMNDDGTECNLSDIAWDSLQMRMLKTFLDVPVQEYSQKRGSPFTAQILARGGTDEHCEFYVEGLPLKVSLLFSKRGNTFEYAERGTLLSAIETYRTIISFAEN